MSQRKRNTGVVRDAEKAITDLPKTRREAQVAGALHYYTGKPCKRGHIAARYTLSAQCSDCERARNKKRAASPWRWCQHAHGRCRKRALERGLEFSITIQDIHEAMMQQDLRCPVFGTKLKTKGRQGRATASSASVDRLDPDKGYVKGNIAVISLRANRIKSDSRSKDILAVGEWLKRQGY